MQHSRGAARVKALTPGSFLRHEGHVQLWLDETSMPKAKTEPAEVMVEADMGSLFRLRCMHRNR